MNFSDGSIMGKDSSAGGLNVFSSLDVATVVQKARAWKALWRDHQAALPFEEKLSILLRLMQESREHPRRLE